MADRKLSPRQQRFVDEYLVDLNASAAYRRAYACSERVAYANGGRLLQNAVVALAIEDRRRLLAIRSGVTPERVLQEFAKIAFSDMRDYASWGPSGVTLVDSSALDEDRGHVVSEVSESRSKEGGSIKFKLHDKVAALTQIGRHFGMFTDKIEDVSKLPLEERKARLLKLLA